MSEEPRSQNVTDSFLEALHSEIVAGTGSLSGWIKHVQANQGIETLFELEAWLRGLRAFFDVRHIPLNEAERSDLIRRSFSSELRIVREAIQLCEKHAADIVSLGRPEEIEFEAFVEGQMRRDSVLDYHIARMLEQPTPLDSLARLMESLNDLRVTIDSLGGLQSYQVFLSIGRTFRRDLKHCRYVDMLLSQRFRVQYDQVDSPVLSAVLRSVPDEPIRRNTALTLLHLYRLLRYLKLVARDLARDHPLRHLLVLFALLHEEMEALVEFLRARFLKGRDAGHVLSNAAGLIVYSLKMESQRVFGRELLSVVRGTDASQIYTKVENGYGLLSNCYQSSVVSLVQAFDRKIDAKTVFPSMVDSLEQARRLRQELWDLRQYMKHALEMKEIDLEEIMKRLVSFRESSLRYLMYSDWGEFERFSDALITSSNQMGARAHLRKFVSFLETLVQEVSKRSVLRDSAIEAFRRGED